jgi:alpha-L-rhamnosidase
MYRTVAGLKEASPGYKQIIIAPQPGGKLSSATAELKTIYGLAKSAWKIEDGNFKIDIVIPANTTAEIVLPKASGKKITEQMKDIDVSKFKSQTIGNDTRLAIGSGTYHFEYSMP